MYIPVWLIVLLPGVSAALAAALPWMLALMALLIIGLVVNACLSWGMHVLSVAANALPDWQIWHASTMPGRLLSFCVRAWFPLLLVGFVVFSLVAHTLLPR